MLADEIESRLVISYITYTNFKSYSGTQISFSAIVGPNGSGKSNIIDGLLFVFGCRPGRLRQSKVIDLIYTGENLSGNKCCSVSITFEFINGGGNWIIERKVDSRGRSEYFVDEKSVSLSEMQTLLKEKGGIDVDKQRFLVLQGEVESIAQMKPKGNDHEEGLLEYLEDIIGSSCLKPEIIQTQKIWEESASKSASFQVKLKAIDSERNSKVTSKTDADRTLQLYNSLITKSTLRNTIEINSLTKELDKVKYHRIELKEKLPLIVSEINTSRSVLNEYQENKRIFSKNVNDTKILLESKRNISEQLVKKVTSLEERKRGLKHKLDDIESFIETEHTCFLDQDLVLKNIDQNISLIQNELLTVQPTSDTNSISDMEIPKNIDSLKQQRSLIIGEISDLESKITFENKQIERKENVKNQLDVSISTMKNLIIERDELKRNLLLISDELDTLKTSLRELRIIVARSDPVATETTFKSHISHLNKITGVFGRLGDLGKVKDPVLEGSLRACCGSSLENIVVDTAETGQKCIDVLKKKKLGRSTFIVLEKMKNVEKRNLGSIGGIKVEYLFEKMEFSSPKFANAFYFVIRDTILAKNLEEARILAFSGKTRNRVVTVDGEIIEKSGAMTGGMTRKEININNSEREVAISLISETCSRVSQLESQSIEYTVRLEQIVSEIGIKEKEMEYLHGIDQSGKVDKNLEGWKDRVVVLTDAKIDLIKKIEHEEKKIQKTDQTRAKELREMMSSLKIERIGIDQKLITKKKLMCKSEKDAVGIAKELVSVEEKLNSVESELKMIKEELCRYQSELENFSQQFKETFDLEKGKNEEIDKISKTLVFTEKEIERLDREMDTINNRVIVLETDMSSRFIFDVDSTGISEKPVSGFTECEIEKYSNPRELDNLCREISTLEKEVGGAEGVLGILEDWIKISERWDVAKEEARNTSDERDRLRLDLDVLMQKRHDMFMDGFLKISMKLKEIYQLITFGGNAELELVDSMDPFNEGVLFSVMPPMKNWRSISQLSGGEKTLSSLALVFALHHFRPTPFYLMDEIDAALDFKNVSIIANYIRERTRNAQFIIVSLRNNMFESADQLVGVYKTEGCTHTISILPNTIEMN